MSVLFTASILPIGEPVTIVDDRGQPYTRVYDEHTFDVQRNLARDVKVCVGHDSHIGNLEMLLDHSSWWRATFVLDDEFGAEVKPGQPVSVGLAVMPSGNPVLREVSLVKTGHVAGAVITHRDKLKPITQKPSARPLATTAPKVIRRSAPPVPRISPHDEDEEFRRRLDFYGDSVPFELVLENMRAELQALKGRRW